MKKTNRKKGSVTILIMLFFVTLVSMIMVFVSVSKDYAVKSTARELGLLWTNSILAEYDINLQERYNIFGFYGLEGNVEKKINYYAGESYSNKRYVTYKGCRAELYDYSLANVEMSGKQIVAVGKLAAAGKLLKPKKDIKPAAGGEAGIIRNKAILNGLPSKGSGKSITMAGISDSLKKTETIRGVVKKGTDEYFENQYIFKYFKDRSNSRGLGKTFFQNEVEYIICGKTADADNEASIRRKIIALREAMNLIFVIKDPKANAETLAAAELITPGPAALATQKAIQAAWALAESYNDYQLLITGKRVPVVKDEKSWAIDLESIVGSKPKKDEDPEFNTSASYVDPGNIHGEDYEDYLGIMAYSMDEKVKLLRILDLIQINMKYCYYGGFKIIDYNGGVKVTLNVNRKSYEIEKEYQPE